MVEVDIEILQRTHGCETERKKQIPPSHQLVAGGGDSAFPDPNTRHPSRLSKVKLWTGSWNGTCLPEESQKSAYMGQNWVSFNIRGIWCFDWKGQGVPPCLFLGAMPVGLSPGPV